MTSRIWKEEKNTVIDLFIPVLAGMLLIITIWRNDYTENTPFGILDGDRSSLPQPIMKQSGISPSLDIVYYAGSGQDLKQVTLNEKTEAGVMILGNFSRDMLLKKSPWAVIFTDCPSIITGGGAVGTASSVLDTMNVGVQLKILKRSSFYPSTAQDSLGTFSYVSRVLYEPQGDYIGKMGYLLASSITMQTLLISFFIPLMIWKRRALAAAPPKQRREKLKDGILRTAVVTDGTVTTQSAVLYVIGLYKNIPLRGEIGLYLFSAVLLTLAAMVFSVMLGALTRRLAYPAQLYMICSNLIISISGLIFSYHLVPKWFSIASRILPPVVNVTMELRAMNLKGIGQNAAWPRPAETVLYTMFWLAAGGVIYTLSIGKKYGLAEMAEWKTGQQEMAANNIWRMGCYLAKR